MKRKNQTFLLPFLSLIKFEMSLTSQNKIPQKNQMVGGSLFFIEVFQLTNGEGMNRIRRLPFCNPYWNNRSR